MNLPNPYNDTIYSFEVMSSFWGVMGNLRMQEYCEARLKQIKKDARQWDLAAANVLWLCLTAQEVVRERTK